MWLTHLNLNAFLHVECIYFKIPESSEELLDRLLLLDFELPGGAERDLDLELALWLVPVFLSPPCDDAEELEDDRACLFFSFLSESPFFSLDGDLKHLRIC